MIEHDDDQAARVMAYFDGELDPADEPAVLDHLASCAQCRAELGDAMAVDTLLHTRSRVTPIRRTRRIAVVAGLGAVAAAAAVIGVLAWPQRPEPVETIALAADRAVEARFEAGPFAGYRPYAVVRGAAAREAISLDTLASLERRGDRGALVAALVSSGDLARAEELARGALAPADRAAVALAAGDPERALVALEHAPPSPAASWNHALAAASLGLVRVARHDLDTVVAAREPGWADEAQRRIEALDAAGATRDAFPAFQTRGLAMVAGTGPAITPDEAARFPAFARMYFLDALRVAGDREEAAALAPIADALDRASGTTLARDAIARVLPRDFAVRGRFRARYRALVARNLEAAASAALVDDLARAGGDVVDLRVGAIVLGGVARARVDELASLVHGDPWFELAIAHERLAITRTTAGDLVAMAAARRAADACPAVWAYRCGQLALDAAELSELADDSDVADRYARRARDLYAAAVAPPHEDRALAYLAELARHRGRRALAYAMFDEIARRDGSTDCVRARYAEIGRARLDAAAGRFDDARASLPAPDACSAPPDELGLASTVDLARETLARGDLERARTWIAAARASGDTTLVSLADAGEARLAATVDPSATAGLDAWLAAHPDDRGATRSWIYDTLVDAAARRAAWSDAAAAAARELGVALPDGCVVIASVDGTHQAVAVRDAAEQWSGRARSVALADFDQPIVPADLAARIAPCAHVAVIARPPVHGRVDLLPAGLAWHFVGATHVAPIVAPPRLVVVTDPSPPLALPALAPPSSLPADAVVLRGPDATPTRVLAAIADATYVELDSHGVAESDVDGAYLALSPEPSGRFALTSADLRNARLHGAPVVVLAACRGARVAPYLHRRWSLPDAFLAAGARVVIATDVDIPDPDADRVFADIRARITRGDEPDVAVAAVRAAHPNSWVSRIAVFE